MKNFLLFVPLFFSINCYSQEFLEIDTVIKEFYYDYNFQEDSTDIASEKYQEMVLQLGKHSSKFISANLLYTDSLLYTVRNMKEGFKYVWPKVSKLRVPRFCEYAIFKNYPDRNMIRFVGTLGGGTTLKVDEKLSMNWVLDIKKDSTIVGYNCQRARCTFAGRDYIAWYTMEIPISDGPYKFHGLPGLIIRISDTHNEHVFQLYRVKNCKQPKGMLYIDETKTKDTTAVGFAKAMKAYIADMYKSYGGNPNIHYSNADGESKTLRNIRSWNNYIERY
ncbi:GLPGLI family protein [Labilibaculum sp.]|uniref:GLPGLI family protein n=1 Tax=Labilibaculum sp. TaxID=2060723 RepID=UPI00356A8776